jgi:hypothetical protein
VKLTRDEPGVLFVLEGEGVRVPPVAIGCLAVVLVPFFAMPLVTFLLSLFNSAQRDSLVSGISGVFSLFWLGVLGVGFSFAYRRAWVTRALRADGRAGTLEIVDRHVLTGRDRTESVRLTQLAGINARADASPGKRTKAPAGFAFTPPNVRLTLRIEQGSGRARERSVRLGVEGIDKREEVADLAYRLGAAANLAYQRVVRSDPRELEIELSRAPGPGLTRIPGFEGRADYSRDQVASAAVAAAQQERMPPFDPAQFACDHKVTEWSPQREVRFEKPFGWGALGCLPFVVTGFLAGPAVFVLTGRHPQNDLSGRIVASLFLGFFGLVIGGVALLVVYGALPRRVVLDWSARTIRISGLFRQAELAFGDLGGLVLKCVRTYHSGGKNSSSYNSYRCEISAQLRDPSSTTQEPVLLVKTNECREDPDTPYRQTLPLVTELAAALSLRRHVIDYE